mgnify:CR=1 FL=1
MKVSVIIPGNYVYECLDSLMNQSLDALRFEVIVVLNGTRDPYWEQLSRYAKRHGNIRLLHEAVAGVSNARNVGMKHAWGDFFAFVDDGLFQLLGGAAKDFHPYDIGSQQCPFFCRFRRQLGQRFLCVQSDPRTEESKVSV